MLTDKHRNLIFFITAIAFVAGVILECSCHSNPWRIIGGLAAVPYLIFNLYLLLAENAAMERERKEREKRWEISEIVHQEVETLTLKAVANSKAIAFTIGVNADLPIIIKSKRKLNMGKT